MQDFCVPLYASYYNRSFSKCTHNVIHWAVAKQKDLVGKGGAQTGGINCALQCPNASAAALARFPSALYTKKKQQNACTHTSNTHSYIHSLKHKLPETATATLLYTPPSPTSIIFYSLSHHPSLQKQPWYGFTIGRKLSFFGDMR